MSLPSHRYLAIDVMRGLTLALMIIVNMSISETLSFSQLLHATWNGFTLTDSIFPTFLFVVGAALGFTLERYEHQGRTALVRKVAVRAIVIFLCGLVVSNFPFLHISGGEISWQALSDIRIMGVLQRIALVYAIAALLVHFAGIRGVVIYCAVIFVGNAWATATFGDYSLAGNAALKLDTFVFGASHLYHGEGIAYDPEGLLGTLPATINVLAGYLAVRYLRAQPKEMVTVARFLAAGAGLLGLALVLNGWIPINKKLWTSSYVLCTTGIDLAVFAILILVIDVWKLRGFAGYFEIFGKNALAIYILAELAMSIAWTVPVGTQPAFMSLYDVGFSWAGGKWASLFFALTFAQLCWFVAYLMDRNRLYVRI